jgi:hypothetical protein
LVPTLSRGSVDVPVRAGLRPRVPRDGKRGPVWYAKYRLADGVQVQKRIGPAWAQRGRPADGDFTKRTAEAWLHALLVKARVGLVVRTGVLFEEAAAYERNADQLGQLFLVFRLALLMLIVEVAAWVVTLAERA